MKRTTSALAVAALAVTLSAGPASAHHKYNHSGDKTYGQQIRGTVCGWFPAICR